MRNEFDRFIEKVSVDPDTACWNWTGAVYRGGYGHFRRLVEGKWKMSKSHRYSYEHFHGPIPQGMLVRHSCDNPSCVNPDHLSVGTHKDNMRDMMQRGRKRFGTNPHNKQHSLELAEWIREFHKTFPDLKQKDIAEAFETSPAQVCRILNNKIWRNVCAAV